MLILQILLRTTICFCVNTCPADDDSRALSTMPLPLSVDSNKVFG